jgi:NAD(P)-dependent dehydrogenase (short-subunit alcohol dehydrogenase family)
MLKAKVALITGSTSGIGLGIARGLAQSGAHIVLNGFGDRSEIEELRTEIQSASDVEVIYNAADMSKPDEIVEMITETQKTLGSVDIVVNNAGIQKVAPIEEFPVDKWDAIIAINLSSAFHTIRTAIPLMKARGWGRGTMNARWEQGISDASTTLRAAPWLAPKPREVGVRVFDVMHEALVKKSRATTEAMPTDGNRMNTRPTKGRSSKDPLVEQQSA